MKGIVMFNRQEKDVSRQGTRQVPVEKKMKLAQYIRAENMENIVWYGEYAAFIS